jgi:hypothetical protein
VALIPKGIDLNRRRPERRLLNAVYCAHARWPALALYIDDGSAEIDNNAAVRALRGVALRRP